MFTDSATNKDFFGRTQQKKILKERTKAFKSGFRQNIAMLGEPFIGKTSLIGNFLPELLAEQIVPIYAETREEPFDFFTHRFIGSLLYQYLKSKDAEFKKDDLKILMKRCKSALPKTLDAVEKIELFIRKKNFDSAYDILLDLPQLVHVDSGRMCAVIIEEFHGLAGYKLDRPFLVLGKKIMAQRNTFYIVTSSSVSQAKQILAEKLQLLFGNFEIMELEEFDFTTSKNFLLSRFEPFAIGEEHIRFMISFTDGHPFYMDVIGARLKALLEQEKKRKVTTALLGRTLDDVLFSPLGHLHQHFANIIYRHCRNKNGNGVDVLSIMTSLSNANHKLQRLADSLNGCSRKGLLCAISDLERAGLVEKIGSFARIEDSLLRFWLNAVHYKKRLDFTHEFSNRQKVFAACVKKSSADCIKASREDMYEKTVDLFRAFKDDIVRIGQKKHRLPTFSDVTTRIVGENGPYIIGHSKGKNWICQIHQRDITEKHVLDFLKDAKTDKYKFHRKVLIVLNDIDDNAKLLCKNSGVWVWNLKTLNLLLDLYGKYKVIMY